MSETASNIHSTQTLEDGQLLYLPPGQIEVLEGFNPRTYFDESAQQELNESARKHGIIQSLVVRRHPDKEGIFALIAGERRLRAANTIQLEEVPAIFRDVDDRVALALAGVENRDRDNISIAEEANECRRMLDACDGDRQEAAKQLGLSRSIFDSRMLLLHATKEVLDALAQRKIKIGHAELLSTLPEVTQNGTLDKIVEEGISVKVLRDKIDSIAMQLSSALFSTEECNGCPYNSSSQAELFSVSLDAGKCSKRSCFADKTKAALEAKKEELSEKYNCVYLDIEKEAGTWALLVKSGLDGVGADQYDRCQGCANFGAIISSVPGSEGKVDEDVCFDNTCRQSMIEALNAESDDEQDKGDDKASTSKATKKTSTGKTTRTKKTQGNVTPKKVIEQSHAYLRSLAHSITEKDDRLIRVIGIYSMFHDASTPKLSIAIPSDRASGIDFLYRQPDEVLDSLTREIALYLVRDCTNSFTHQYDPYLKAAVQSIKTTSTDLEGTFTLSEEFLKAHTKKGIESLMKEAKNAEATTFPSWYNEEQGDKAAFAKLLSKKTDVIISTILKSKFDFSNFIPSCISKIVRDTKVSK